MPAAEVGEQTAISPKTCSLCTARLRSLHHSKQSLETKRRGEGRCLCRRVGKGVAVGKGEGKLCQWASSVTCGIRGRARVAESS